MAKHLNLDEQEQLDRIKHFWSRYGNLITWVLIVVLGAAAAWSGWNYWQRVQSPKAAALYDEVEYAALARDVERMERALAELKTGFDRSTFAARGALLTGRTLFEAGQIDRARAALVWVLENTPDESYQALARLRLAGLDIEAGAFEPALEMLQAPVPPSFAPLFADRRGDVLLAQGNADAARVQYQAAWLALDAQVEYRHLVEVKLAALGVDVATLATATEVVP